MDLAEMNLRTLIRLHRRSKYELTAIDRDNITYEMILALAYVHSRNIMHLDIKPDNFMYMEKEKKIVLADFGSAKWKSCGVPTRKNAHISTVWYKAPELLLYYEYYDESVNIWALAITIFELYNNKSIFSSDEDQDQLEDIIKLFGGIMI